MLVDASLLLNKDWHDIAQNVWHSGQGIAEKLKTDKLMVDCLRALNEKYKDGINLMFDSSVHAGGLAKVQNYFDTGVMVSAKKPETGIRKSLKKAFQNSKTRMSACLSETAFPGMTICEISQRILSFSLQVDLKQFESSVNGMQAPPDYSGS